MIVADTCDLAQEIEELSRAAALAARRSTVPAPASSGRCRSCGEDIEPRRLAVLPATTLCASCARDVSLRAATAGRSPR